MPRMDQDNLRESQVVPRFEAVLNFRGCTEQRRELEVLAWEEGELKASPSALHRVSQGVDLHRPKGVGAALLPHAIQRLVARRGELLPGGGEVQIGIGRGSRLALSRPKVPVELGHLAGL